jgi:hypothetical protein
MDLNISVSTGDVTVISPSQERVFVSSILSDIRPVIDEINAQAQDSAEILFDSLVDKLSSLGLSNEEISILLG